MGFTALSDVYDPIKIKKLIGQRWLNEAKIISSGIVKRDDRPMQGTLTYELRQTRFQDTSGQAVKAGGTISSQKHTQTRTQHPILWRYQSSDEPDVIEEIEVKDVPTENATMAEDIRLAASQYVDDSIIACIKGTGAGLTNNQTDQSASVIALTAMVNGFATLKENGFELMDGAMAMRDEPYWKMVQLGLVAATSNTFGNDLQTVIVQTGKLPTNVLGLTPIISDKFTSLGSNLYYLYYIGANSIILRGNESPEVEIARATVNKKFSTITNFKIHYGLGFDGVTYGGSGAEDISDTDLATSGNWTLAAANYRHVKLVRVKIKTA